ncbi:MAG: glycosyltransferase [Planctomycetota bacterium]|nr:glycosyltransferase [Planctomycetota bacterium]
MVDPDKNKTPEISVIVTTYNKERELTLVLEAYRHQSFKDFELIIADDGSGEATKKVIEEARSCSDFPIIHSWQEDDGFRAARSRNLAVSKARGKILALTDGDCVPLPNYLETVKNTYKESCYLAGERYLLRQEEASHIEKGKISEGAGKYLKSLIPEREEKRLSKTRRKNRFYRTFRLKIRPTVMTCNFALSKDDLLKINGFDERYVGWGHEDTDLGRRLRSLGIKSANELSEAKLIHLWHKTEASFAGRVRDCANASYFDRGFYLPTCRKGLKHRDYSDLKISIKASNSELQELGERLLSGQSADKAEIAILLQGKDAGASLKFPKDVHVPVLVLERGASVPTGLLKKARLILTGEKLDESALKAFQGTVEILESPSLNEEGLKEIRRKLDEII